MAACETESNVHDELDTSIITAFDNEHHPSLQIMRYEDAEEYDGELYTLFSEIFAT